MQGLQVGLDSLRELCLTAAKAQPGSDLRKEACAQLALGLILEYSGKRPTGGQRSPLRVIAGILFEAATREKDADFKRACRTGLRNRRP